MAIKRYTKFPQSQFLDKELDSIVRQANADISDNAAKVTIVSVGNATASGLFVAASSGGLVTRELKYKAVTLSNGTIINLLVTDL